MEEAAAKYPGQDYSRFMEDQGALFYMNGKNGRESGWFVNGIFPAS